MSAIRLSIDFSIGLAFVGCYNSYGPWNESKSFFSRIPPSWTVTIDIRPFFFSGLRCLFRAFPAFSLLRNDTRVGMHECLRLLLSLTPLRDLLHDSSPFLRAVPLASTTDTAGSEVFPSSNSFSVAYDSLPHFFLFEFFSCLFHSGCALLLA